MVALEEFDHLAQHDKQHHRKKYVLLTIFITLRLNDLFAFLAFMSSAVNTRL